MQVRGGAYGTSRGAAVSWVNKRGFLGGDQDAGGLTHLGAREYDPNLGRFVSVDPVFEASNPQQINGYAYGDNSPMVKSDASGLHTQAISDSCNPQDHGICWPNDTQKTYKEEFEEGQAALQEACSMTPYIGGACDAVEGLEYLIKGEYGKAAEAAAWTALSGIPIAKWAFKGSKLARWIVKKVDNVAGKIPDYVGNKAAEDVVTVGKEEQKAQRAVSKAAADERKAAEAAAAQKKAQEPPPKKDPDSEGTATVTWDPDKGHAYVKVEVGDKSVSSHAFALDTPRSWEPGESDNLLRPFLGGRPGPNSVSITFKLKNGKAALDYIDKRVNDDTIEMRDYNFFSNSCITYCADVLREGGRTEFAPGLPGTAKLKGMLT